MILMTNSGAVMRPGKAILHRLKFNWQIYWRDMTFSLTYNAPLFQLKIHVHEEAAEPHCDIIVGHYRMIELNY
jgi:hypothetical protein